MPLVVVDNPDVNIWEENPHLSLISEFKEFRQHEGDKRSSDILKAIYYIWDPKSEIRDSSMSENKLINDITENLIGEKEFDWDKYAEIRDIYLDKTLSKLESLLLKYEAEVKDLDVMLTSWKWNKTNVKNRAEAVKQYKTLLEEYMETKDKAKMEADGEMQMRAGYQKSMLEGYG